MQGVGPRGNRFFGGVDAKVAQRTGSFGRVVVADTRPVASGRGEGVGGDRR